MPSRVAIIACDTTGVSFHDQPISIAAISAAEPAPSEDWDELSRWSGTQTAPVPITPEATAVHGLTAESIDGTTFDLAGLKALLSNVDGVVSLHPRFDAKMIAKVLPDVLQMTWWDVQSYIGELCKLQPRLEGRTRAESDVASAFAVLRVRNGKTKRSKVRMVATVERPRMPVHPHVEGNLPIVVKSRAKMGTVFTEMLGSCAVGTSFRLWAHPDADFISAYASGYCGGQGLCFLLPRETNRRVFSRLMNSAHGVSATLLDVHGFTYHIEVDP